MTWMMPWEGDPHDRLWLAWPVGGYALGDSDETALAAQRTWAAVANAAAEFEPVTVVVDPADLDAARAHLSGSIELREAPLDDAWMRDVGPTYVIDRDAEGGPKLGGVDWIFNGWGAPDWAVWGKDHEIARSVLGWSGGERIASSIVNEGGGIHVDGRGTVLLTETVQRGQGRNAHLSRVEIEAEMLRTIGATTAIWLDRGLTRDYERFGTRGHVDIVAAFAAPGRVLVHDQTDPSHPDHEVTAEVVARLAESRDAAGNALDVVRLPAPSKLRAKDVEGVDDWVDYSYVNHVLVNGGVIACGFDDPMDEVAAGILAEQYPGRTVVTVDARELYARGGGIHCITQQQPSLPAR
ncbi:agmatine deiminase family protein [Naasia lichenicola]|uniref:Agmatine deiminase family protein n=1 Tax=Naasia lichenicola TaxID=2565933 RepID=A0A4S4FTN1_9MICO|nr:agmatine deiminase family protein [Naasia lichenicola]THG33115.1 agmatine deiminase family protein [Naasia lichenicola]